MKVKRRIGYPIQTIIFCQPVGAHQVYFFLSKLEELFLLKKRIGQNFEAPWLWVVETNSLDRLKKKSLLTSKVNAY